MEGMNYFVAIRHGKPENAGYADETLRPLSEEGKIKLLKVAEMLKEKGLQPVRIYASPILRATQTAEVLGDYFGVSVQTEPALGYEFNSKKLSANLKRSGVTYFVGHAPHLANFVNQLVDQPALPQGLSTGEAAVVCLDPVPKFLQSFF